MPLVKHAPKCRAQMSIQGLVQTITGKVMATEQPKKRGWFG
jgi:hypothetical protein